MSESPWPFSLFCSNCNWSLFLFPPQSTTGICPISPRRSPPVTLTLLRRKMIKHHVRFFSINGNAPNLLVFHNLMENVLSKNAVTCRNILLLQYHELFKAYSLTISPASFSLHLRSVPYYFSLTFYPTHSMARPLPIRTYHVLKELNAHLLEQFQAICQRVFVKKIFPIVKNFL